MSDNISIEIESNSTNVDISIIPKFHKERNEKNVLKKKRLRDEEESQIQMQEEFIEQEVEDEVEEALFANFPMFQETNISNEEEESPEIDDLLYFNNTRDDQRRLEAFYPDYILFTESKEDIEEPDIKGVDFSVKKRSPKRLDNFKQKHYIRVNIKRSFMNTYLLKAFNKKLKKAGFVTFFQKFPQKLANNVKIDFNKILMNMRLKEIFRTKELYKNIKKTNYQHNLKLVNEIEEKGNPELNLILNRKFRCLFEEYVNSEEFGKELIRIKKSEKKNNEYYEKKYIYLAKHFTEFIFQ